MSNIKHPDCPLNEVLETAMEWAQKGAKCHQKYTCQGCKTRWTNDKPNVFSRYCICPECKHETDTAEYGCNYVLLMELSMGNKDQNPDTPTKH